MESDIEEMLYELEKDLDPLVFVSDGQQTEDGEALHKRNWNENTHFQINILILTYLLESTHAILSD